MVYFISELRWPSVREVRAGAWLELKERPWKGAAYWLALRACLPCDNIQDTSPGGPTSVIEKMPCRPICEGIFSIEVPSSKRTSLCQVDINLCRVLSFFGECKASFYMKTIYNI